MFVKRWLFFLVALTGTFLLTACGSFGTGNSTIQLPAYISESSPRVQEAYQFAIEHPEMLVHQPCYCGCGVVGHTSSLHCFVRDIDTNGVITLDSHGVGCGICVDIALDVKRLSEEGLSQFDIRHYIDATYGFYGPPTDTTMPPGA
jgi:hypothetical protein